MDASIDDMIQALQMLKAVGVPGTAKVKKGTDALQLGPIALDNNPGIVYTLVDGSWVASQGSPESVSSISFP